MLTVREPSPAAGIERFRVPERYLPDDDLVAAVQVAILLRQPLLLTGDPGTGKTQLASWVAYKLSRPLIRFNAKSTTAATDLLYAFDAVREFRDAQRIGDTIAADDRRQYLTFQALGRAIALTYPVNAPEMTAVWNDDANRLPNESTSRPSEPKASVVLIDEIDKAPRDVPNDLLTEFETGQFFIPEFKVRLSVQDGKQPIVIATSNSEKALPDAYVSDESSSDLSGIAFTTLHSTAVLASGLSMSLMSCMALRSGSILCQKQTSAGDHPCPLLRLGPSNF